LKFSHGASASDGLLMIGKSNDMILTTSSLKKPVIYDLAHNNGALITISRFLALKCSGELLFDMVQDGDFSFFNGFYKDNKQLEEWKKGFSNCVEVRDIKNTDKAKQLFFPTLNSKYHIIVPLYPSSLSEEIYSTISQLKFGEVEKVIRKQINKGEGNSSKYHTQQHLDYPNIGVLNFGGAQPQNISMLNKNRGGNCYLLTSQPPSWQSQLNPPNNKKSFFDYFYPVAIKEDITYLRDFLIRNDRIELSIKNPQKLEWIEKWVNSIIEEVFYHISTIQNLPSGWASQKEVKLKQEHQYLLDPYNDDEQFQAFRKEKGWQKIVRKDFSNWLNNKLKGKDNKFTPQKQHTRLWSKLFETSLREDVEEITWDIKYKEEKS
jgi:CRISPR-associated protein Csy1